MRIKPLFNRMFWVSYVAAMIITFGLVDVEDESENINNKSKVTKERQKPKRQYVDSNDNLRTEENIGQQ